MYRNECCIVNAGPGAWAFEEHARLLSEAIDVDISESPREFNYILAFDEDALPGNVRNFIPLHSIHLAADKRLLADIFATSGVATPRTFLANEPHDVNAIIECNPGCEWCLKWPTGCGAAGHRLVSKRESIPVDWPRPYVVQEFIRLDDPEVYRLYGIAGEIFGWNVRRFPANAKQSPWVAHARGARYASPAGVPPADAVDHARQALTATGLIDSFGCADLMRKATGEWVVLEVGTDGIHNHVDRQLDHPAIEQEINNRLNRAFRQRWRDI